MDRYGAMAQAHWQRNLPQQYRSLTDPETFFRQLGDEAARQIEELSETLAGEPPTGEPFATRAGRMAAARQQAEELVLRELVLTDPETPAGDAPDHFPPMPVETPEDREIAEAMREFEDARDELATLTATPGSPPQE